MRDIIKLSVRLMAFALISALLLAVVNALTKERIKDVEARKVNSARIAVLGDYDFEEASADLAGSEYIKHIYAASDGGAVKGYVYELESVGFAGVVSLSVGIDAAGTVAGITIASHTETKGLGTDLEAPFLAQFVGLSALGAGTGTGTAAETAAPTAEAETGASPEWTAGATAEAETGASPEWTAGATAEAETGATTDGTTGATTETELSGAAASGAVAEVDGMTGATYSTNAVKNAVAEALAHFAANYLGGGGAQ